MYSSGTDRSRLKCDGTPGGSGEEGGEGAEVKGARAESEKETDSGKVKVEGKKKDDARIRGEEGRGGEQERWERCGRTGATGSTYTGGFEGATWNCKQEVELGIEGKGKVGGNRLGMMADIELEVIKGFLAHRVSVGELGSFICLATTQFT